MEPDDVESRLKALEDGHNRNREKINQNRQGVKTSMAVLVFMAIVFGLPIAEFKWQGRDNFSITRDTVSPINVIIGGLVASALFVGDSPKDLLKALLGSIKSK